ncbi:hypothetical protein OHB54_09365 [Streptomyces sp. NBC_01007]|nr:hypothetical protein OHB54_09365 [Streptomyces sp. NBC_01007]
MTGIVTGTGTGTGIGSGPESANLRPPGAVAERQDEHNGPTGRMKNASAKGAYVAQVPRAGRRTPE